MTGWSARYFLSRKAERGVDPAQYQPECSRFWHVQEGMLSTFLKRKVGCGLGPAQYQLECSLLVFLT